MNGMNTDRNMEGNAVDTMGRSKEPNMEGRTIMGPVEYGQRYQNAGTTANSVKKCYSVKDLQDMLGVSRPTIYELLQQHKFRWIMLGRKYLIFKKSFDAWMDGKEEE